MPALLALFGPKQGLRIPLQGRLTVGRGATADVQLVDGKVSREHCRIDATQARACIEDLGSQNGTFVNGTAIGEPTFLDEGDQIAIGDTLLLVAGDEGDVCNSRYGEGTVVVAADVRAHTAAHAGPPAPATIAGVPSLCQLASRLASTKSEEEAASVVLDAVETALKPRRATLLLRTSRSDGKQERERIVPLATRGKEMVISISHTLLELATASGHGVLVEDAMASHELRGARSVVEHGLRSVMVVPWGRQAAAPRGFLHVDRDPEQPFSSADLVWLETVGHLVTLRLADHSPNPTVVETAGPVGASPAFVAAVRLAMAAARVDSTVVLLGETGTGKEEIARLIHANSRRTHGPFIAVNCGAIAENLAESELFGHEKGAFTGATATRLGAFESADGGTLFLDEIGDLAPALQVTLLRVLQERAVVRVGASLPRQVDVRTIAATHCDLTEKIQAGLFREDLFFRLNVLSINLPSLRERQDDIPLLARTLLERIASRLGLRNPQLSPAAEAALAEWDYPGNVRELGNILERILVMRDPHEPGPIDRDDVRAALGHGLRPAAGRDAGRPDENLADAVARTEKTNIEAALRRARGVKSHAARLLGISRPTLDKKIADLGIDIWAND
jgi:Transcriptional regulator containing PAS, AAA-type ATPase, and DNA-binding domains